MLIMWPWAQYLSEQLQEPMKSHDIPTRPWSKISVDLFQLDGSNYLVMVDHYSNFFELDPLRGNTSANTVIRAMKRQFARHKIPDECITNKAHSLKAMNIHISLKNTVLSYANYHIPRELKGGLCSQFAKKILKKSSHEDPYLALLAY